MPDFKGKIQGMNQYAKGTVFIDRLLELGECSKQARFEEVLVEEITDEVCSDDEEDSFGFNNLFGLANMTDPKERWRRMLTERAFMEKHPNFQLIHHAIAPMDPHESMLLETVKEESLCDLWGNLTINALNEEGLEFDRGISLVNGSSQANWAAELLPVAFISKKIMPNERDPRGKFAPNYEGPYVVKEAFSGGALLLKYPDGIDYHHRGHTLTKKERDIKAPSIDSGKLPSSEHKTHVLHLTPCAPAPALHQILALLCTEPCVFSLDPLLAAPARFCSCTPRPMPALSPLRLCAPATPSLRPDHA
ncbi:hypothetical protein SLEP1_g57439 [Rubroshorea leprosula]|uniref:Uncharacterized protein n=1 Tax=Rubroshorea leprosula TaxID=152421 RepID=A0AAV5MPU1_9ROSI|nr:hypothetical protein SLEP1_g57439 [Rubroshorea leprosula]